MVISGLSRSFSTCLPTLQEWCCHHPCKARFRLAGSPLPGGRRTLWIAMKGFRSHHPPSLDFSWRNVRKPAQEQASPSSFDHLVGAQQERLGELQHECLRGSEVNDEIEL